MATTRYFNPAEIGSIFNTTGTWTLTTASNVTTYNHTDGDDTSILSIPIPKHGLGAGFREAPQIIRTFYTLVTADLDAAPTAVLNKLDVNTSTGVVTRSAITQAITFGGVDTTGTAAGAGAAGTHIAIVTITDANLEQLDDTETLVLELTFNAAATTVLKVTGFTIDWV